jgi:hypothetical protein
MVSHHDQYQALLILGSSRKPAKRYHRHRIIPGYAGGKYTQNNIAYLTRLEHIKVHRLRYKLYLDRRDLLACKLLGDALSEVEWLACAREGGRVTGAMFKREKRGVCGRTKKQMSIDGRNAAAFTPLEARRRGGKVTGSLMRRTKKGIFGIPPKQDKINRAKGGRVAGTLISYHDRTKGVIGTVWATDGKSNLRLKPADKIPKGFYFGRSTIKSKPLDRRN